KNATQNQMRLDGRAWVGVGSPSLVLNAKDPFKVETRVVVLGKSPATDVVTRMGTRPFPTDHILQHSDLVLAPLPIHNGTAYPGSSFPIRETGINPITPKEKTIIGEVLDKRAVLYFFGEITYRDIFKVHHWTHFCYAIPTGDVNDMIPCTIYNDSDADPDTGE
ncbi:MAG: hypothetical protein WA634_15925, partial [Silvibacterium sp.]